MAQTIDIIFPTGGKGVHISYEWNAVPPVQDDLFNIMWHNDEVTNKHFPFNTKFVIFINSKEGYITWSAWQQYSRTQQEGNLISFSLGQHI